jgi:ubiquinone/menaquinone biosynthesis C-methylase UbiE
MSGGGGGDHVFAGSIPAPYDRHLGPLLFAPYAADLAARAARLRPARVLEIAAGTGIVTAALARILPQALIVATDLNAPMLDIAAARPGVANVRFQQADAMALPFDDDAFDLVACQFGVMFFPDRVAAFAEARRVLAPGRPFLFNAWDRIENNPVTAAVGAAIADLFAFDAPAFYRRIPFSYHDAARIEADLRAAGFTDIAIEKVAMASQVDALSAATGLCQGTPLRTELESQGVDLETATAAAAAALAPYDGKHMAMSAHVVTAR